MLVNYNRFVYADYAFLATGTTLLTTFFIEHIMRVNNCSPKYRPSYYIQYLAYKGRTIAYNIGKQIAYLSSFYKYLHLEEMVETAMILGKSGFNLVYVPVYTVIGYFDTIQTYRNPLIIACGTFTLVGLSGLTYMHFPTLKYYAISWTKYKN